MLEVCDARISNTAGNSQVVGTTTTCKKHIKKTTFNVTILSAVMLGMILCSILAIKLSTILFILISGMLGIAFYGISALRKRKEREGK